jgi:trehalose 6-phosphate synthase
VTNFRRSVRATNSITFDDNGAAEANGRTIVSRSFPIGIDVGAFARMANEASQDVQIDSMRRQILGLKQIIGVDRLDYSKGLPGRMQAFARLLERHPEYRRAAPYLQIASPTREEVGAYAEIRAQLGGDSRLCERKICGSGLDTDPLHSPSRTTLAAGWPITRQPGRAGDALA